MPDHEDPGLDSKLVEFHDWYFLKLDFVDKESPDLWTIHTS